MGRGEEAARASPEQRVSARVGARMRRWPGTVLFLAAAGSSSLGCRGPEEELLDRYLLASQRSDNQTVAALSMVAFPHEVESWNVLELSEATAEPYAVPELRKGVEAAKDERDTQFKEFGRFRQENYETLRRIGARLREDPEYHFSGRLGELQDQWEAYRLQRRQVVAKLRDAEIALEQEIRRVNKSLQRPSSPEYLTGETLRKQARVRVTTPSGDAVHRITLTKYELENQFGALVPSRWIITAVEQAES